MPIYEYECSTCKKTIEVLTKSIGESLDEKIVCDNCKTKLFKKVVSKNSFVLKGDGWAQDNYAKPKKSKEK